MTDLLEFDRNGKHYTAGKGFAFATKDGKKDWNAIDVFTNHLPTEEEVLSLERLIDSAFEKIDKGEDKK